LSTPQERMKYKPFLETGADLNPLFECLLSPAGNQAVKDPPELTKVASGVVSNLLEFLDPQTVLEKYSKPLVRLLQEHNDSQVRRHVVSFLKRSGVDIRSFPDLTLAVVKALIDPNLGVGCDAKDVLLALIVKDQDFGSQIVFSDHADILREMCGHKDETLRIRVYEFAVAVAKVSPALTNKNCHQLLACLSKELETEDQLLQMSLLEVLLNLVEAEHGHAYLRDQGVLTKIQAMFDKARTSPLAGMLVPAYIKFFGRAISFTTEDFSSVYPSVTTTLFEILKEPEDKEIEELQLLALETIGFLASTPQGKKKLVEFGSDNFSVEVDILSRFMFRGNSDQKVTALAALASILSGDPDDVAQGFFQVLNDRAKEKKMGTMLDFLFNLIKQPFADISKGAYAVLGTMGSKPWGLYLFGSQAGLFEYLLDRTQHNSKEKKVANYDVLKVMTVNPEFSNIIQRHWINKINQFVKEGPFYVEGQVEVAMQEG